MNEIEQLIERLKEPDYKYYGCELSGSEAKLAITALTEKLNGGWIPCSERLPEPRSKSYGDKQQRVEVITCQRNGVVKEMMYKEFAENFADNCGKLKEENSKLKAEIEQLELSGDSVEASSIKYYNLYKKSLDQIESLTNQLETKNNNFELYCDLVDENERLHAELGKLGWKNE